eukprot:CAMPEP_0201682298 /NCGR_PEP_ID=MMETSP0494-20130426/51547_1 /ASSEMBLY_ACC=CAM_ASM_000839 /TAXON_ID=420259 /ORGANISM="Thalassiosira gravida, Strain GMp14c1" /LENGTH=992 /DNA_ID=CAMNT_0048166055 /DNA_START=613 /DNA_END=3591 /DNA_ORIENTATION=+
MVLREHEMMLPNQPSLKSATDDGSASDSSWRQLQQVTSIDKEEMLKLQFSKSELTVTSSQEEDKGPARTTTTTTKGSGSSQEEIAEATVITTTPKKINTNCNLLEGLAAAATTHSASSSSSSSSSSNNSRRGIDNNNIGGTKRDSPGDLQAPPSTLSRTSSLSNSPTDEDVRTSSAAADDDREDHRRDYRNRASHLPEGGGSYPRRMMHPHHPPHHHPHHHPHHQQQQHLQHGSQPQYRPHHPHHPHPVDPASARRPHHPPPHLHPSRLNSISFQASIAPQHGAEANDGEDHSPSASTISTKASLAVAAGSDGATRSLRAQQGAIGGGAGSFFGKGHPPTPSMKPKHPVHVKKSREESLKNVNIDVEQGNDAKRRKLSDISNGMSPPNNHNAAAPSASSLGIGTISHVALDGRVMAESPAAGSIAANSQHSHHSARSLELGAMPSWETAGKPLAGWSVCSGMTGMGSLGKDGVLSAFSFSDAIRPDNDGGVKEEVGDGNDNRHGGEGLDDDDDDPSPKSILSKVGEKRKSLAPGTHVQFSREGAPGGAAMELPSSSALPSRKRSHAGAPPSARSSAGGVPPPPPQDDYYYDYPPRYPPGQHGSHPYDQYGGRPGPPPSSRHGHHPGERQLYYSPEEDPYYDHYYGHYPPPPPHGYPPHPRGGRHRPPPPPSHLHQGDYPPPPSHHHRGLDGRAPPAINTVHTPPSSGSSHHLHHSSRSSSAATANIHHPHGPSHHHHHGHHLHHLPPTISSQFLHIRGAGGASGWDKDDDAALMEIMRKFKNPKNWDPIAKKLGRSKTSRECQERWTRYLKPGSRKGQWTDEEDAIVVHAVQNSIEDPFTRWSDLAQKLPGRVGKQVRDRWVNHLNPAINHLPFSREDDLLLWEGHRILGKRWVEISSKYFKGTRSENHIKNRWYSASFKKFIAKEFGPEAYQQGNDGVSAGGSGSKAIVHPAGHPSANLHHPQYQHHHAVTMVNDPNGNSVDPKSDYTQSC